MNNQIPRRVVYMALAPNHEQHTLEEVNGVLTDGIRYFGTVAQLREWGWKLILISGKVGD